MKISLRVPLILAALVATATIANAQQTPDPRVADLVRAGKLRSPRRENQIENFLNCPR